MGFTVGKELLSLVEGKRVALVGPSSHLMDSKIGGFIDGYDVVCRVNDYPQDNIDDDYGSRTDVVFDSCDTRVNEDTKLKMDRFEGRAKKIKLIIVHCIHAYPGDKMDGVTVLNNLKNNNIHNVPTWWIGVENYYYINNMVGLELNSGMAAILILLEHQPKELFITGMTFYLQWKRDDFYNSIYRKGYHLSPDIWFTYNWSTWEPNGSHEQDRQIGFFRDVLLNRYSDIIKIDSYLKNLLGVKYNNVVEIGS